MSAVLAGSAALGDYMEGASDLDVAVVAPTAVEDPEALAAPLRHAVLPCPARRLELVVYRAEQAAAPSADLEFELDLNTGVDADRLVTEPDDSGSHWYLIDLAIAREHGVPLAGPAPRELIGEPPRDDVLAALAAGLRWALAREPESPNTFLNACRAARFALEGDWVSKSEAGRWAIETGSDPELARMALDARRAGGGDLPADRVAAFAHDAELAL
jgi:Domain of unknown function (DUF4111)